MHRKRVFLVDDSLVVRQMVRDILTADGHHGGGHGRRRRGSTPEDPGGAPDLVLLDILMPKLAGDQVLQSE